MTAETLSGLSSLRAPTSDDIDALAQAAFERLPASFRRLSEGLVIRVAEFPDDETLDEMGAESEFELLGLFRGRGLAQRGAVEETGELPNMIWLYRRPLLDFWCDGEDSLARSWPMFSSTRLVIISASRTPTWRRSSARRADPIRRRMTLRAWKAADFGAFTRASRKL